MFRAHVLIMNVWSETDQAFTPTDRRSVGNSCDDTRGCVMQFWPPDDEHIWSKHVEAWNELAVKQKFCASSWLITEIKKRVLASSCLVRLSVRMELLSFHRMDFI